MTHYKNLGNDSGVVAFEIGKTHIAVQFENNSVYEYTYHSAGREHIENMKTLALQGEGLNSYINKHVKKNYSRKIR